MDHLTTAQLDRAAGVLLGTAAGDALGAGYEFGPPLAEDVPVTMKGGGGFDWEPGEWTDDTSMALVIAQAAASSDLRSESAQDQIALGWVGWAATAKDVGVQTSAVLGAAARAQVSAASLRSAARLHHERSGRSGGNGSLMRTAPVALAFLDDADALVETARSLSALTHFDPEAGEACALWCLAIRHAVLTGELDLRLGLSCLADDRATLWSARITEAESKSPSDFDQNGWVVQALQGAWSAISRAPVPIEDQAQHLQLALEAAVRGGRDTDTVSAIAGGLLGGAHGAAAVPEPWQRIVHGWPGFRAVDLIRLGESIAARSDRSG